MEFVYLIRPTRPGFVEEVLPEENDIMMEHFGYLQGLLREGKLILAGPCLDRTLGITVFKADSEEEARSIMENDPAVIKGVMSAELHPYRAALLVGRD
jgi:uncharacterized protein YciI